MFIFKNKEQLQTATQKARQLRPRVEFDRFGRYRVSGRKGGYYTVICSRSDNGYRLVSCTCKAGDQGLVCYHSSAALAVHTGLARLRQQSA